MDRAQDISPLVSSEVRPYSTSHIWIVVQMVTGFVLICRSDGGSYDSHLVEHENRRAKGLGHLHYHLHRVRLASAPAVIISPPLLTNTLVRIPSSLEATIWAVPSLIENAVAVSVIGVLMGPMYPIVVNHAKNVPPRWLLTGAIGWIAGIGIAGSAVLPLITGVLAARFGISSLQPL